MKKTMLLATTALVAGFASQASAVDVEVYGQVNKGFAVFDDGVNTGTAVYDNDISETRFGFKGSQALDNGLTASVLFEYGLNDTNQSDDFTQGGNQTSSADGSSTILERHSRVGISGAFGTVLLGHTSEATDGAAEVDLGGAKDVTSNDFADIGGGIKISAAGTVTASQTDANYVDLDGNRGDLVRYDSPVWNGIQGKVSAKNGGDMAYAVTYNGDVAGLKVAAALGMNKSGDDAANSDLNGNTTVAVSVKHDSGVAGTVSWGKEDRETGSEGESLYLKGSYTMGMTEFAVDWAQQEDVNAAGTELTYMGVAAQHNLGNGVSAAAYYKTFENDDVSAVNYDSVDIFGVNLRVKF